MGMDLEKIAEHLRSGRYAAAADEVARLKNEKGSRPDWALALAARAAKLREPRMMALALALWPEALGADCERLLMSLGSAQARACLALSPELLRSASARAAEQAEALAREERGRRAREAANQRALAEALWEELSSGGWALPVPPGARAHPAAVKARRQAMAGAAPKAGRIGPVIERGRIKPRWDPATLRSGR